MKFLEELRALLSEASGFVAQCDGQSADVALTLLAKAKDLVVLRLATEPDVPSGAIADDTAKLLDNDWRVRLFRNALGSYTAVAVSSHAERRVETDDFTPSKALYRLTEKVFGRIV